MEQVTKISTCRMCQSKNLEKILSFGRTPPANSFLKKSQLKKKEPTFPLEVYFCKKCGQLQLDHVVNPDLLFKNYLYVSSTSPVFVKHFQEYSEEVFKRFNLNSDSLVVDIGSNDGILLSPFKKLGARILGVDPAQNLAKEATQKGLETWGSYFDPEIASKIAAKYGSANIITANNVFAHVHDLDNLVTAVKLLLDEDGVFVIEAPYLVDFLEKNLFDTVYHEHLSYLFVKPLTHFFKRHAMEIFDVIRTPVHGGSIRVFVKKAEGKHKIKPTVAKIMEEEKGLGLLKTKTYKDFANKIEQNKKDLLKTLLDLKAEGKMIVGFGAPAKGNTLLNYFGIDNTLLDYIVDDSPLKQGLFTPGTHIPVVSSKKLIASPKPDYILILAWNFADSIIEKLFSFSEQGGKFIIPIPSPTIYQDNRFISKTIVNDDLQSIVKALGKDAEKLAGKTILISGGSGFLGSYINQAIKLLNKSVLKRKCKVISVDNYITGTDKKNFLGSIEDRHFDFIYQDVRLPILFREKIDYIIHAAGLASPYYYQKYPLETIESAVIGAKNLLELARMKRVKGFLFFSSSEIYGNPEPKYIPTPEDYAGHVSSVGPRACYDESKRLGETLCLVYHQQFGVPVKIIRPFNVYGPGMKIDDYRVIPTFISKGLEGGQLPVHGSGNQTRTFCYVSDAVAGFFKVLLSGKNGEVYNVGNEKPEITMYQLAQILVKSLTNGAEIKLIDYPNSYPAGEPQRRCPDLTKIRTELGYQPLVDLESGIKRTLEWYRSEYKL